MQFFLSVVAFILVGSVTPGPNNLMALASGANWGFRRSVPFMVGVTLGYPLMLIAVGLGLDAVFARYPEVHRILKYVAFAFLVYLAWRIGTSARPNPEAEGGRPITFLQAVAFQWVNPKGWALAFGAISLFTSANGDHLFEVGMVALVFALFCFPSLAVWCLFGTAIAGWLADDRWRFYFNWTMALVLVLSALPTLF